MEKQYSVQFFTNFVENLQNLCHTCLDFSQSVEVSGYVCVEIDNVKKERYVLSEMIQSNGRSISESYCTKVFKSTPSGPGRNNFHDISNETISVFREACMPQHSYRSGIPRIPTNIRHQAASTPSNSRQSTSKTRTPFQNQPQNFTSTSPSHNSTSDPQVLDGDKRAREFQRHSCLTGNKTDCEFSFGSQAIGSSTTATKICNLGKRCFLDTSVIKSEDGDVVIIKEEPGSEEQDEDDSGEPPPVKRREESFHLPEALTAVQGHDPSEEDFQDSHSSCNFELPTHFPAPTPACPDMDSFLGQSSNSSSGQFSAEIEDFSTNMKASIIMQRVHPPPIIMNTSTGKNIICQLCRNSTSSETAFVMHMNAHPSCRECGVFVGTHMDLRNHIQVQHGKMNMHKCKFCEKAFLTRSGMIEHQRLKHENTAPRFVCVICGHVCVRRRHLEDHLENVHKKKNKGPS